MLPQSLVAVLVILGAVPAPAVGQTKLEWKFNKGDVFYQKSDTMVKQAMTIMGMKIDQDMDNSTIASFTVVDKLNDGSVVLEQKIEEIGVKNAGVGAPIGQMLQQMKGASFKITLSPKLKVTKFEGYEDLMKKIGGDDPVAGRMLRAMMTEDTLKKSVEEAFAFVPDAPVKKGDSWERQMEVPLGPLGALNATNKYTYEGQEKGLEKISVVSNMKYTAPKDGDGGLPFKISKGDLKADNAKGTIYFDAAKGRLAESEMKMKLKGSLTISAMGNELTMDMEQDQTVKITVTTEKPKPRP